MSKKALAVIIITVCLLFADCKAPADQEQKNNTETAVLSTETQEEDWKQVHSTQKDLEKLPQKIQKIFSDNQTFFDVEKGKEYDKNSFIKTLTKEGYRPQWAEFLVADWDNDGEYELLMSGCRSISGIPGFPTRFIGNFPCRRITSCGNISACAGRSASIIGKKSMYSHVP